MIGRKSTTDDERRVVVFVDVFGHFDIIVRLESLEANAVAASATAKLNCRQGD